MSDQNDLQRLALMEAMSKALKEQTDPRRAGSLRGSMDSELVDAYYADGVDRRRIVINGVDCGTYSVAFSKERDGVEPAVDDYDAFCAWLASEDNRGYLHRLVDRCLKQAVEVSTAEGELPDGVSMRRVAEPKRVKGTRISVDKEKVAKALGPGLADAVAGVLAAGEGE